MMNADLAEMIVDEGPSLRGNSNTGEKYISYLDRSRFGKRDQIKLEITGRQHAIAFPPTVDGFLAAITRRDYVLGRA